MEVVIAPTESIGEIVADDVATLLEAKPHAVIGLATGSSPLRAYDSLADRVERGELSFAEARAFTLDEYVGLPAGHPCSYRSVIHREFVARVDFADGAVTTPDGNAADLDAEAESFDWRIAAAGGVDLQILGIGTHGHIAFNEPGSSLASDTRVKMLTEQTRRDNARFFSDGMDAVPQLCLTQGIATIMRARHILLVATGEGKADAVRALVEGGVSAFRPASILQHHPRVTVVVDPQAASRLVYAEYYSNASERRPSYQT